MDIVKATLWIYQRSLKRACALAASNWILILAPLVYSVIFSVAIFFLLPLGFLGRLLLLLVGDACMSSGLHLIENILKTGKLDFHDFIRGFTVYLWEIVRISFILWIPMMVAGRVLASLPNGPLFFMFIQIAVYIFFNALPELIYQGRASGLELLGASYNFIVENWVEWFIPNILIGVGGYALLSALPSLAGVLPHSLAVFVHVWLTGLFLTYFMVYRGALFAELHGSSRRGRIYRYRAGGF